MKKIVYYKRAKNRDEKQGSGAVDNSPKNYTCSRCGASCYYDGRCGDGPIMTCGCDKMGMGVSDGRDTWYPESNAHPVEGSRGW